MQKSTEYVGQPEVMYSRSEIIAIFENCVKCHTDVRVIWGSNRGEGRKSVVTSQKFVEGFPCCQTV